MTKNCSGNDQKVDWGLPGNALGMTTKRAGGWPENVMCVTNNVVRLARKCRGMTSKCRNGKTENVVETTNKQDWKCVFTKRQDKPTTK